MGRALRPGGYRRSRESRRKVEQIVADHDESERVSLSPSGLNYWRPFYLGKVQLAGAITIPLAVFGAFLQSTWIVLVGALLVGVAELLAIRGERDAFFTASRIHRRPGLLGLSAEDSPIRTVDQVLVDRVRLFTSIGDLIVKAGQRYVRFDGVPNADAKASRILSLAQAAREHSADRA